jgi:hypothetical protein
MSVDDESVVSRRFVAQPGQVGIGPSWSPNRAYGQMYIFLAVLVAVVFVVPLVMNSALPESKARSAIELGVGFGFLVFVLLGLLIYYRWRNQQTIVIDITGDRLMVSTRPGDVFPLSDISLGPWGWGAGTRGTALHLRCSRGNFVLGGRDYRVRNGTRVEEAAVPGVDAWLWTAEFGELLTMVGRQTGVDVQPPTPGELTHYVLFPNPQRVQARSPSVVRKQHKLLRAATNLAIGVSTDAIRVVDPNTNALIASAPPMQVTVTPATYEYPYTHWLPTLNNVMTDMENKYLSKAPVLVVGVPGMAPLTIACLDTTGGLGIARRFSWREDVPAQYEAAEYAVAAADWPMLVDKFGLATFLESRGDEGSSSTPKPGGPAVPVSLPNNRYEADQLIPSGRRRGGWGFLVALSIASLAVIALGAFPVWVQHFGVPARIAVEYCGKLSRPSHVFDYVWDYAVGTCHWQTSTTRVEVWGAHQQDMGREIDVHIMGGEDVVDGWNVPLVVLAVGCVLGVGTVVAIVRRLARAPT